MAKDGLATELGQLAGDVGGQVGGDRTVRNRLGDGCQPGLGADRVQALIAWRVPNDEDRVEARVVRDGGEGARQQRHLLDDQAGGVERVLRGPEAGQDLAQGRLGLGAEVGDLEPGVLGEVGEQGAGAAGGSQHGDAAALGQARGRQQRRRLDQLLGAADPDDALLPEDGVHHPVLEGEGSGVGDRRAGPRRRPADLEHHQRLPQRKRALGNGQEAVGVADPLQQRADDCGARLVEQEVDEVVRVEHRLVAARDQVGEPDRTVLGEAVEVEQHRAALGEQADPPGHEGRRHRQTVGGDTARVVDEAEAIGALERDAAPLALIDEGTLQLGSDTAGLAVAGGEQDGAPDPGRGEVVDNARHGVGARHHVGAVDRLADRADAGVAGQPELGLVAWVDEVDAALVAVQAQVADQGRAPGRVLGCADQRQRGGVEHGRDTIAPLRWGRGVRHLSVTSQKVNEHA